jgi:hypothetical protein
MMLHWLCGRLKRSRACIRSYEFEIETLWVQEAQQFLFIVLAERGSNAHMAKNSAGDTRREAFRGVVATRAILLEDAISFALMLRRGLGDCGRFLVRLGCGWSRLRECTRRDQEEKSDKKMLQTHNYFPLQVGNRKR